MRAEADCSAYDAAESILTSPSSTGVASRLGWGSGFCGFAPLHHAVQNGRRRPDPNQADGEADGRDVDVIGVEIDVAVHLARELGDGELSSTPDTRLARMISRETAGLRLLW